jgi:hypothetical protein
VRWSFCDSGFAIMVLKAPFEPSGSQELQARRAAPGPNSTHPPFITAGMVVVLILSCAARVHHGSQPSKKYHNHHRNMI